MALLTSAQKTRFVSTFYNEWDQKFLKNRGDYNDSVNVADIAVGLPLNTIPEGLIPSFAQLTSGLASRISGGSTSSGTIVAESQAAQNSGANTIDPPLGGTEDLVSPQTEAAREATLFTQVSDLFPQRTVVGSQIQAAQAGNQGLGIPIPVPPVTLLDDAGGLGRVLDVGSVSNAISGAFNPGASTGAFANDDGGQAQEQRNRDQVRQRIETLYGSNKPINNQANALTQYENFSYQLGWYIAPPSNYNKFSNYRNLSNYFLLAQSGGASGTAGSVQSSQVDATGSAATAPVDLVSNASRNPNFDVDFYIDNLEVVTRFPLAGSRMSHTISEINFVVTEPYGISLVRRLQNAVEDVYRQAGVFTGSGARYASALYVMAIKFWGVDENGLAVRAKSKDGTLIEKYIPFVISEFKFSQGSRFVEYRITGRSPFTFVGFGQERGIILDRVTLTGRSVKDVLGAQTSATSTADAATAVEGRTTTAVAAGTTEDTNSEPSIL